MLSHCNLTTLYTKSTCMVNFNIKFSILQAQNQGHHNYGSVTSMELACHIHTIQPMQDFTEILDTSQSY